MNKKCSKCQQIKSSDGFSKNKTANDGLQGHCKKCCRVSGEAYSITKSGLLGRIYRQQRSTSRKRSHTLPLYSLKELREWAFSQPVFHELYDKWVESGHDMMQRPSCDRLDDYKPYSLDRLQIVTWQQNFDKSRADIKNGINNKRSKTVIQMNKSGVFMKEFYSASQAYRETGVSRSNISTCCRGNIPYAGGFRWNYS